MTDEAQVTRRGALSMQVCVPLDWDDAHVKAFADRENLCGTENGWFVRKGREDERVKCESRSGFVHIMLDA